MPIFLYWVSFVLGLTDLIIYIQSALWLPRCHSGKEFAFSAGDVEDKGLIPGLGRSPGVGNGSPLQYSCLEISTDRGAWQSTVHRVTKTQTQLGEHTCIQLLLNVYLFQGETFIDLTYAVLAKSLQSCPTICNPMNCSPPGSSVHKILQAISQNKNYCIFILIFGGGHCLRIIPILLDYKIIFPNLPFLALRCYL